MLTLKQVRNRAQRFVNKEMRYRMQVDDIDTILDAVLVGDEIDAPEVSRESIIAESLREHVKQYPKSDRDQYKKMVLGERVANGGDPHSEKSIREFLPEAIETLQAVEKVGTAINPKIELLKAVSSNPVLIEIFRLTYDWRMAYGVGDAFDVDMQIKGGGINNACKAWPLFVKLLLSLNEKPAANNMDLDKLRYLLNKMPRIVRKWAYRVLMRDLKIGIKDGNIRRVWKNLLPKFDVTLCSTIKRGDSLHEALEALPDELWVEPKYDGLRTIVVVSDAPRGEGKVYSRKGLVQPHLQYLVEEVCRLLVNDGITSVVLDCEAMSTKSNRYNDAVSAKTTQVVDGKRPLRLMAFDMLSLEDFNAGHCATPQSERREALAGLLENAEVDAPSFCLVPGRSVGRKDRHKRVMQCYNKWRAEGYEGVVIKDKDAEYAAGERNRKKSGYHRIKPFETADVVIVSAFPGKKGTKYEKVLGGFVCKKGKNEIRVGGGYSDKQRKDYWNKRKEMVGLTMEIELQEGVDEDQIKARHAFHRRIRLKADK